MSKDIENIIEKLKRLKVELNKTCLHDKDIDMFKNEIDSIKDNVKKELYKSIEQNKIRL